MVVGYRAVGRRGDPHVLVSREYPSFSTGRPRPTFAGWNRAQVVWALDGER